MKRVMPGMARILLLTFLITVFSSPGIAQHVNPPGKLDFYPGAKYDAAIPTLEQAAGHAFGEEVTSHAEAARYLEALAKAAPQRARLAQYATSHEGRALYYFVVGSEANIARLDEIKRGMRRLADPRGLAESDAEKILSSIPPVVWIAAGVHGNEISSTVATLLAAYHLLAAQNDDVARQILSSTVVVFDPMQNPDGRDRFVNYFRSTRGAQPDPDQQAAEHNEVWPGGRTNHYLFDMNRDWFALTQPETRGRVAAFLDWFPVVFVDLHEMGSNSTYYFAPPAQPWNPNLTREQTEWLRKFGQGNSEWFDRFRFDYFTREVYDSFYPGYGEGWPMFHGSIGMTYEQASVRGLIVRRADGSTMHYRDSVHHHFISSLSTALTAARNSRELLRYFYQFRRAASADSPSEPIKEFLLLPGRDPNRAAKLAALLMKQGIEVKRADRPFTNARARDFFSDKAQSREFPAGTFIVSLAQPGRRLAKALLERHTDQGEAFLQEQLRRRAQRLPEQFYDVTGWSLPLLYGVEAWAAEAPSAGSISVLREPPSAAGRVIGGRAHLAYLLAWGTNSAAAAAADLLRQGLRLHRAGNWLKLGETRFPAGTLIIKTRDNPDDLHARMEKTAAAHGVEITATDRAWIEEGVNLGSAQVRFVEAPRVAMAWDDPASSASAGWARYLLEQVYGLPVTALRAQTMRFADLSRYNVIILPSGAYSDALGEAGVRNLRAWVEAGGTLVTFAGATRWLTEERVGLLGTTRELAGGAPDRPRPQAPGGAERPAEPPKTPAGEFDYEKAIQPEREAPGATPGALFRVRVDAENWFGLGYEGGAVVMVDSGNIFTPLKLDRGRNVAVYEPAERPLSGFTWEASRKQLGNKAYLMHQRAGRGNVVAFAEDPNYRAFLDGLNVLVLNAVLFGPSF
jgi:hypothetical protein